MTTFRAPSTSTDSSAFGSAQHVQAIPAARKVTQKPAKIKKALDGPARTRINTDKARTAASAALRKAQRQGNHQQLSWSYLLVGNISPIVDESTLREYFKDCGTVVSAHIRCSGGVAMTVRPQPNYYRNHKVRQYGVVTFSDKRAVRKALLLNGSKLGGRSIVVCRSAGDLPDVKEEIQKRLDEYQARNGFTDARLSNSSLPS
ncbi:hypothetical protein ID866_1735 [Astraeus odoratus]|nr:hypothetical protein ID866_1735 [Astraeus odoratus]